MQVSRKLLLAALLAAAAPALAQSAKRPIPITDELTEAHTAIGMQYLVVGRIAATCQGPLGKPASFARDTLETWTKSNQRYVNALSRYQEALLAQIEAQKGHEGMNAELDRFRETVQKQGAALVAKAFANRDPDAACPQFDRQLSEGKFNIGPEFPQYASVTKLLQAIGE